MKSPQHSSCRALENGLEDRGRRSIVLVHAPISPVWANYSRQVLVLYQKRSGALYGVEWIELLRRSAFDTET